ncbi:bifunctional metallophosphatase/5'-nucleotidase [soil metagenome]
MAERRGSGLYSVAPYFGVFFIFATGCGASAHPSTDSDGSCLSIGAWNDLHGQIQPVDLWLDTGNVPAGGVIALADAISDLRATRDTIVLLDAGDLFTGSLESTLAEGAPIIEAYRVLGVDAVAIGNHEFDFGPVGYSMLTAAPGAGDAGPLGKRGALRSRMASASFPFLSANIHQRGGGPPAWPDLAASTHIRRSGYDVGVVGYTTTETDVTTSYANVDDLDFATRAGPSVAAEIRKLRATGASPIVLLAHASLDVPLPQALDQAAGEPVHGELASLIASLGPDRPDVIIAGHRHAWMLGRVDGIPVVSSDRQGLGLARIRFCREPHSISLRSIERVAVLAATPPRTELGREVTARTAPWLEAVKASGDAFVTTLPRECPMQAVDGTAGAEQVATAMAANAELTTPPRGVPVVAVMNAGALRAPLHKGVVRFEDLFRTFPFEITLSGCETTRDGLLHMLHNALANPSAWKHLPFAIAGAQVVITHAENGSPSLVSLALAGETRPGPGTEPVWILAPDFVLDGGDGFLDGLTCTRTVRTSTRIRDVWRERLLSRPDACDSQRPQNISVRLGN